MYHHIGCLGLLVCHYSFHLPAFWSFSNIIFKGYEKKKGQVGGDSWPNANSSLFYKQ